MGKWRPTIAVAVLAGCAQQPAPPRQPLLVQTVIVGSQAPAGMSFTGTVRARIESDLAFRIPGKIVSRFVAAGQGVRRGQPLARLDLADYALAANAAQDQADAARAENKRAQDDLRRLTPLVARGFVTGRSVDLARAEADAARARLGALEASARSAGNQSGYTTLVADADGVVMSIAAEPGQVVAAGQRVVRLAWLGARDAVVAIPENSRKAARAGAAVTLYGDSQRYAATLFSLAAEADAATRTYEARYEIVGGGKLPLGATATVRISSTAASRVAVPLAALHDNGGGPGVWVVGDDNRVAFRPVHIAALGDETADIGDGLRAGERVIALGAHLLKIGQLVRYAGMREARSQTGT